MSKLILTLAAIASVTIATAQDYEIRRQPFGGGYNVYGPGGQLQSEIRTQPFGGGYNVYGPGGQLQSEIRAQPFGGGYRVHTMPRTYGYGY